VAAKCAHRNVATGVAPWVFSRPITALLKDCIRLAGGLQAAGIHLAPEDGLEITEQVVNVPISEPSIRAGPAIGDAADNGDRLTIIGVIEGGLGLGAFQQNCCRRLIITDWPVFPLPAA